MAERCSWKNDSFQNGLGIADCVSPLGGIAMCAPVARMNHKPQTSLASPNDTHRGGFPPPHNPDAPFVPSTPETPRKRCSPHPPQPTVSVPRQEEAGLADGGAASMQAKLFHAAAPSQRRPSAISRPKEEWSSYPRPPCLCGHSEAVDGRAISQTNDDVRASFEDRDNRSLKALFAPHCSSRWQHPFRGLDES